MAIIRPSSDLRNKYNEISEFCNKYNEPVFITKNGTGDLVVISNAEYERLCGKMELHRMLDEAMAEVKKGNTKSAAESFANLEKQFGIEVK